MLVPCPGRGRRQVPKEDAPGVSLWRNTLKIRKINDTTVNCIITQEDMKKHGIHIDDFFDRKKNAVEFIRGIILKAVNSADLNIKSSYTAMKISVLPDKSVSLTISQDPIESNRIREAKEESLQSAGIMTDSRKKADADSSNTGIAAAGIYIYEFGSIREMRACCSMLTGCAGIGSSVYYVKENGLYYLILARDTETDEGYDSFVLRVSEFGKMVTCDDRTFAYLKEHSECILRSRAVQQISELYK